MIAKGDVLNLNDIKEAMQNQEAVFIALGSGNSRKGKVRSHGTKNIIDAMSNRGIQRLICQTTLGCGDSEQNLKRIMFGWWLKEVFLDHEVRKS